METKELIQALRADAEWAHANEWETPITLGDNLVDAANALKAADEEIARLKAENADLRRQLSEKTELLDKAVEDLKTIADWYRECRCDDGICGLCKHDADHGLDGDANECAGFYKNDCFEWRGQQAGKGGPK